MWFDRGGRIVQQELGLGTTMRRMAFEMAFENWRLTRDTLVLTAVATSSPEDGRTTVAGPPMR
jgi:hypothetical protein